MLTITDHGARGDGRTFATAALQSAVDAAHAAGGGVVRVPAGTFLTGPVELRSRVRLHLEPGAVLQASPRLEDWPPHGFLHAEWGETRSLLFATGQEDIAVTGEGVIDLAGDAFMHWDRVKTGELFGPELAAQIDDRQRAECTVVAAPRPAQPLFFDSCRRLRWEGVLIRRSPCWTLTFSRCDGVAVRGLRIENDLRAPNADGIHLCGCRDVTISDCVISGGDDAIAMTGITDWSRSCERIAIANCVLQSSSAGVRLGHLASQVRDVVISGLLIHGSNRGFCVFAGEGGVVERVSVANVRLSTRVVAGHWWGQGEPVVVCAADAPTGRIHDISFSHLRARCENSVLVAGTRGNVSDVRFADCTFEIAAGPNRPLLGRFLDLQPAAARPAPDASRSIPWLQAWEVRRLDAARIRHGRAPGEPGAFATDAVLDRMLGARLADVVTLA